MEDEFGCIDKDDCRNYPDKCKICSAHYTSEFEAK